MVGTFAISEIGVEIRQRIERQPGVEGRICGEPDARHQQRIAVRAGADRGQRADIGVGAGPVDRDEGLPEPLAEPVAHEPRNEIGAAARRERHDDLDRADRIGLLRPRGGAGARDEHEERESGGTEMKTPNLHAGLPLDPSL